MKDHNDGHDKSSNMHKVCCTLKYYCVGKLYISRKAFSLDSYSKLNGRYAAHDCAQRQWRHPTHPREVSERHDVVYFATTAALM